MKKLAVVGLAVVAMVLGGAALALTPIALASAQEDEPADVRIRPLDEALDELVAEDVITQEQADAVSGRVEEKRDERRDELEEDGRHGFGRRGPGGHRGPLGGLSRDLFEDLDIDREALFEALRNGESIEDIAAAAGIDLQAMATEALDASQQRLDEAIAEGTISEERAARTQEHLDSARESVESGELSFDFGRKGHRFFGPGDDAPDEDDTADGTEDDEEE